MNQFNYKKTPENVPFISNRADPYVTRRDDGTYYFTASVPEVRQNNIEKVGFPYGASGCSRKNGMEKT